MLGHAFPRGDGGRDTASSARDRQHRGVAPLTLFQSQSGADIYQSRPWEFSMHPAIDTFLAAANAAAEASEEPADRVIAIAPLMRELLNGDRGFLSEAHYRSDPNHYTRNAIHLDPNGRLSLFALVWLPGQWTPVHDHGSWGVVGVLEGLLEERAYMAADG